MKINWKVVWKEFDKWYSVKERETVWGYTWRQQKMKISGLVESQIGKKKKANGSPL